MKWTLLVLATVLGATVLSACGTSSTPNDGSGGTQVTDSFKVTFPKTTEFKVARGATEPFTVSVDIIKPELVDEVKITLVSGPDVIITPSPDATIKNGGSFTFFVKVQEDTAQSKPFFNFSAEGVGEARNQEVVAANFNWPLE
jgi:hypothetical protein